LEERTKVIESLLRESRGTITQGRLFSLYSRQIEKYQKETQSRAGWSFVFSIFAMVAGLGFVFWGGSQIVSQSGWKHVAAGSAISTIGGAVSAYITKTFLDVHKVSLSQLNRYFKQPVVNELILTAQRLADDLGRGEERKEAYQSIIGSIVTLIQADMDSGRLIASNKTGE
jgi:hypothetical protein